VRRLAASDLILHGGDFVAMSVLEELEQLAPLSAVLGNNDEASLATRLPARLVVQVEGVRIGMTHEAGPRAGRARRLAAHFPECDAVVYAHTHVGEISREGSLWILNPGSPTERRRAPARSMLELSVKSGRLRPTLVTLSA
jgi:uncharacterized protein